VPPTASVAQHNVTEATGICDLLISGIDPGGPDGHLLGGEHVQAVQGIGGDTLGGLSREDCPQGTTRHVQLEVGIDLGDPGGFGCQFGEVQHGRNP